MAMTDSSPGQGSDSVATTVAYADVARCYAPLAPGAAVMNCADKKDSFPSANGQFKDNTCYVTQNAGGFGIVYVETGCDQLPFSASSTNPPSNNGSLGGFSSGQAQASGDTCGADGVHISINIGCRGEGNPIGDALFALVRFLSVGVGLVIIGSIIVAGIQYTTSQGNPQATAAAQKRIASTVAALLLYFLIYALLNWLIPGGLFL